MDDDVIKRINDNVERDVGWCSDYFGSKMFYLKMVDYGKHIKIYLHLISLPFEPVSIERIVIGKINAYLAPLAYPLRPRQVSRKSDVRMRLYDEEAWKLDKSVLMNLLMHG